MRRFRSGRLPLVIALTMFICTTAAWIVSNFYSISYQPPVDVGMAVYRGQLIVIRGDSSGGGLQTRAVGSFSPLWHIYRVHTEVTLGLRITYIAIWPFCVASGFVTLITAIRRRASKNANGCPSCGYSLVGLAPGAPCPECGASYFPS